MENTQPIAPGVRYRDLQASIFARPQAEWIVEGVYTPGGIAHVRLVSAADPAERKTLALSTLRDRRRFERVEG